MMESETRICVICNMPYTVAKLSSKTCCSPVCSSIHFNNKKKERVRRYRSRLTRDYRKTQAELAQRAEINTCGDEQYFLEFERQYGREEALQPSWWPNGVPIAIIDKYGGDKK